MGVEVPSRFAVNRTGEPPKSASGTRSAAGSTHAPVCASVVRSRATIAHENWLVTPVLGHGDAVLMYTPSSATTGLLQTPPPSTPFGSLKYRACCAPVAWSYMISPPGTNGESHCDETPM